MKMRYTYFEHRAKHAVRPRRVLSLGAVVLSMGACDSLLEVDLPHILTDAAIEGSGTAQTQVYSAIALFECGYSAMGLIALGPEEVLEPIAGNFRTAHLYDETPNTGECDTSDTSTSWFDQIMGARSMLSNDPALMTPPGGTATASGPADGVYDKLQSEFSLGSEGERLSAIAAIYVAVTLTHLGEFMCETAIDGSDLMTPPEVLALADAWVGRALTHINSFGDFEVPNGISSSAANMAQAVRARILWASQDLAGANTAASDVLNLDPTFNAWVTRENGPTRRNKIYSNATSVGFSGMIGINTWWDPTLWAANPATGQAWPTPIPFTGYLFIGIEPDGRTLDPGNVPVRWAEEFRVLGDPPSPLPGNTAVWDTRVLHLKKSIQAPEPREVPDTYQADDDDIPYMTWEELVLIQADYQLHVAGNLQAAIDLVNVLRADKGLPQISGGYETALLADANEVRYMLIEERRREFFNEAGRYWSTKIQNTDITWFPRRQGVSPFHGYNNDGAVRSLFSGDEYQTNNYWIARGGQDARGTGCPTLGSLGGNPGAQAPAFQ